MPTKIAFVTIGQTPRDDLVPAILDLVHADVVATGFGVLDALDDAGIAAMAPADTAPMLVSRLRCGREVHLDKTLATRSLIALIHRIDRQEFDLIVPLCTGNFPELHALALRTPLIEPQRLMDRLATGLLSGLRTIALVVPNAAQAAMHAPYDGVETTRSWVSPYVPASQDPERYRRLDAALTGADLIVMHCVGFDEPMRAALHRRYGCPVLIPRRVIAAAIDLIAQ
ncbi:AroM family protein [Nguyenibacter sp. L1]|uniref:AroM family protein n=1 Tax=Nguyenibacter sp. L1 TaxID=3049350 RepID=UPI002B465756|nr:AroM family protein [Nguyenibacter sp. L1]WRH86695.1 AroM family protein [Nguyenibacter sp. L1]